MGTRWKITAREFVFALCTGFDTRQLPVDGELDCLVIAAFEMEEGIIAGAALVAAIDGVVADEIERPRHRPATVLGEH